MERVAFLIEPEGLRLSALLNPESLCLRRTAGVRPWRAWTGAISSGGHVETPLLFTGGGTTELLLELLFDVSRVEPPLTTEDVRELTRPLWRLAEGGPVEAGQGLPSVLRVVWGKSINLACVVASVAERLEHFTATGTPRRSWLSLRLLRVEDDAARRLEEAPRPPVVAPSALAPPPATEDLDTQALVGGPEPGSGQRLDELAWERYRDPSCWRLIAAFNGIDDPLHLPTGTLLRLPPATALRSPS